MKPVIKTTWGIGTPWELRTATSVPRFIHYLEMDLRNKTTSEFRTVFGSPLGVPNSQVSLYLYNSYCIKRQTDSMEVATLSSFDGTYLASSISTFSPHRVTQWPAWSTSTRPSLGEDPPTRRIPISFGDIRSSRYRLLLTIRVAEIAHRPLTLYVITLYITPQRKGSPLHPSRSTIGRSREIPDFTISHCKI